MIMHPIFDTICNDWFALHWLYFKLKSCVPSKLRNIKKLVYPNVFFVRINILVNEDTPWRMWITNISINICNLATLCYKQKPFQRSVADIFRHNLTFLYGQFFKLLQDFWKGFRWYWCDNTAFRKRSLNIFFQQTVSHPSIQRKKICMHDSYKQQHAVS